LINRSEVLLFLHRYGPDGRVFVLRLAFGAAGDVEVGFAGLFPHAAHDKTACRYVFFTDRAAASDACGGPFAIGTAENMHELFFPQVEGNGANPLSLKEAAPAERAGDFGFSGGGFRLSRRPGGFLKAQEDHHDDEQTDGREENEPGVKGMLLWFSVLFIPSRAVCGLAVRSMKHFSFGLEITFHVGLHVQRFLGRHILVLVFHG
jgi:hypothetical protein